MTVNRARQLRSFGQSIWLDYLSRDLIESGELRRLIEQDGVSGVTSNPAIFEKAMDGSGIYDHAIAALARQGRDSEAIYRHLALQDTAQAADLLYQVYMATEGADGFVSVEVSPYLAHDSVATVREARELWGALDRANVLIKVPATREGLVAIRQLIAEGINVNVTLLFGLVRYRETCEAFLDGLEARLRTGQDLRHAASVASFFLSRIDTLVDPLLEGKGGTGAGLQGKVAISCARLAYQYFREVVTSERFRTLGDQGARPQRLLWASTGVKNPAYPDTKYVESLIGPDTINTMPMKTLLAYLDHGPPAAAELAENVDEARMVMEELHEMGVDMDSVAQQLEDEGIRKFIVPYDKLLSSLDRKRAAAVS